ncbi:ABC transporter G family member 37-like protein [Drosera capensis]
MTLKTRMAREGRRPNVITYHILIKGLCNKNSSAVQPLIVVQRTVLYRERAAAMYSAIRYALAQVANEIPYGAMQALLYVVIIYAMIGFEWTVAKFFWYLFFTFFSFLYFTYFGMMMIAMSPDQSIVPIMSSSFYTLWNLLSGFVIPKPVSHYYFLFRLTANLFQADILLFHV